MVKELVFFRDVANWCVYYDSDLSDAVKHSVELSQYTNQHLEKRFAKDMQYVVLSPDQETEIAVKYAINHNAKLTTEFKESIEYNVINDLKYVLMLHEFKNRLRYLGYKEFIDLFNRDKPWEDYFNRDFELFCVRPKELIATVVAYNSYLKHNKILKLWYNPQVNVYTFKEDSGKSGYKMVFETIDHETALDCCLNNLADHTCLTPVKIDKYFE